MRPGGDAAHRAAEQAARSSYGKLLAWLGGRSGDLAAAEDALADAFAAALERWPAGGVPAQPEAWLLTAARRRLADRARRRRTAPDAGLSVRLLVEEAADRAGTDGGAVPDWRLRLLFTCAHPAIDPAARGPLMLQCALGLEAAAIAEAFLVAPATMAQRLVRAKRRIREAGIPFREPERAELPGRLDAVLQAIYAAFTAGWRAPLAAEGRDLSGEAIWLGRLAVALLPDEPEALGLLALMRHADARRAARRDADGGFVPLDAQDMAAWDGAAIAEAETLLQAAAALDRPGRFQLEAAVQSVHAARRLTGRTDWPAVVRLYDRLLALAPSPVAAVNRAVALAELDGPGAGLAALAGLASDARLEGYQPYWAAVAALSARAGRTEAARQAYDKAISLEADAALRDHLARRRAAL